MRTPTAPLLLLLTLLVGSCHSGEAPKGTPDLLIPEAWRSPSDPGDNLDSVAVWHSSEGQRWVIGTGKATDRLGIYELETGSLIRHVGGPGSGPGQRHGGQACGDGRGGLVHAASAGAAYRSDRGPGGRSR